MSANEQPSQLHQLSKLLGVDVAFVTKAGVRSLPRDLIPRRGYVLGINDQSILIVNDRNIYRNSYRRGIPRAFMSERRFRSVVFEKTGIVLPSWSPSQWRRVKDLILDLCVWVS